MKTYEIVIKPISGFGTPLKADTLFGHICWQAVYDDRLFDKSITELLSDYAVNPFMVVSSAFIKMKDYYILKRPDTPLDMLFNLDLSNRETIKKRKDLKKKIWMKLKSNTKIQSLKVDEFYLTEDELLNELLKTADIKTKRLFGKKIKSLCLIKDYEQTHNTINRLTGTTGEERFAPFSVSQKVFNEIVELVVFVMVRDDITIEMVTEALKRIGMTGFGKDASTGLGKFEIKGYKQLNLKSLGADNPNACYTLSPCVPERDFFRKAYFSPFIRFGRHGDILARSSNPFKNPIIMADEGAVFLVKDGSVFEKPYIGMAISGISKVEPKALAQGYSLYVPVKVEVKE